MPKLNKICFLFLLIVIMLLQHPIDSHSKANNEVDVIIGYKNEAGKESIFAKSNEIDNEFSNIFAISVTIDTDELKGLRHNPNITYIENNIPVALSNTGQHIEEFSEINNLVETELWNMKLIGSSFAWEEGITGKGVNIAIIDTGIAPHSELTVKGGMSTFDDSPDWSDDNGHGTHVAGVIGAKRNDFGVVGIAPDANLYSIKALDENGEGNLDDLIEALDWSIENEMDIINLSLGTDYNSELLKESINKVYEAGILIVGAAGNEGEEGVVIYPAKYNNVIGVAAVDEYLKVTPFSSRGPEIEIAAPGVNILSTFLNDSFGISDGTSQASPHVTGMLALLKQKYPEKSASELRKTLVNYVHDLGDPGRDPLYGHGFTSYYQDIFSPENVSNVKITKATANQFTISWDNPESEYFQNVNVYLNNEFLTSIDKLEATTFTFEDLIEDTTYDFSLIAEDQFGNYSDTISKTVQTKPDKPSSDEKQVTVTEKDTTEEKSEKKPTNNDTSPKQHKAKNKEVKLEQPKKKKHSNQPSKLVQTPEEKSPSIENVEPVDRSTNEVPDEEEVGDEASSESTADEVIEVNQASADDEIEKDDTVEKDESKNIFTKFFDFIKEIFKSIASWFT